MRIGMWCAFAAAASSRTCASPPMLPGLMRSLWMPFSAAAMARRWLKWISATSGTGEPSTSVRTARAQSSSYTLTRTMSQPAFAKARICPSVACASRVSVFVMDCTQTGLCPPSVRFPTRTILVSYISFTSVSHQGPNVLKYQQNHQPEEQRHANQVNDGFLLLR